jgi:hypothetical protein
LFTIKLEFVKIRKILFSAVIVLPCDGRNGSLAFAEGLACAVGAKANVPFAGGNKIELKKMCGGKNKKYRRVGNECRLTRCPLEIWSVCWSPVKMVCRVTYV